VPGDTGRERYDITFIVSSDGTYTHTPLQNATTTYTIHDLGRMVGGFCSTTGRVRGLDIAAGEPRLLPARFRHGFCATYVRWIRWTFEPHQPLPTNYPYPYLTLYTTLAFLPGWDWCGTGTRHVCSTWFELTSWTYGSTTTTTPIRGLPVLFAYACG